MRKSMNRRNRKKRHQKKPKKPKAGKGGPVETGARGRRSRRQLGRRTRRPACLISDGAHRREQDARQGHPQKTETASHCRCSFVTSGLMPLILPRGCECDVKQRRASYGGSEGKVVHLHQLGGALPTAWLGSEVQGRIRR